MENLMSDISWLVIDWGTTNFRAFAMNDNGEPVDEIKRELGLLQIQEGQFDAQLKELLTEWLDDYQDLPIYMGGMVGSMCGWIDAGYIATPASLPYLTKNCHQFTSSWGAPVSIIPGVSHQYENDKHDVMRGEEVQLMGLMAHTELANCLVILPGTHSKHVKIIDGKLLSFSTYMTGELYSILSKFSILGRGITTTTTKIISDEFYRGVREGQTEYFTSTLFLARTHRLFNTISENDVLDYLSGLLIGNELYALLPLIRHELINPPLPIFIVGGGNIAQRYTLACNELGIDNHFVDGDECFISGMNQIKKEMNNVKTI
ncbi:MAG: 2-dehydro-3-deoxygalactonokinase [Psychromonas sp.]|uniref:2-dehydro-3-deoxygalactonokinase n=1 Tax=Psychromonas sp. TaxID=1884585 RepID=UPI0039E3D946